MTIAVYAGSFDPITDGHFDIIERASNVFDTLVIGVGVNPKKQGFFTPEERVGLIKEVCEPLQNIQVLDFQGLLVEFCLKVGAKVIVRGLRAVSDFESEMGVAHTNAQLSPGIDTFFYMVVVVLLEARSIIEREEAETAKTRAEAEAARVAKKATKKNRAKPSV